MQIELLVVVLSSIALIGFGLGDVLGTYLSRRVSATKLTLFDSGFGFFLHATLFIISGTVLVSMTWIEFGYIIGSALCAILGLVSMLYGLSIGKAGVVVPIANSYAIVSVLLGIIVLQESLSVLQSIAIAAIILGLFFLSVDFRELSKTLLRPVLFALMAMLGWGLMTFFLDRAVETIPLFQITLLNSMIVNIILITYLIYTKQGLLETLSAHEIRIGLAMGLIFGIAFLFYVAAFSYGSLSLVSVITAASPVITAALAHKYLGDRLSVFQYTMISVVVGGIMLLVW